MEEGRDARVDEGAGTFEFIKIKKFIRSNSEWRGCIPSAGFSYLREEENLGGDGGGKGGEDSWSTFPPKRPKRYYNYFTRTGIIKTETDASPGEKQARLECITLTVKTLSHARLVSLIFGGNFASLLSSPDQLLAHLPPLLLPGNEEREILIEMENEKREVEIEHRILYEYPRGNLCNF